MDQLQRAAARPLPDLGTRLTFLAGTAVARDPERVASSARRNVRGAVTGQCGG